MIFNENKKTQSNYKIKENNLSLYINIITKKIQIEENIIRINYIIKDSDCEYEYYIEMSDKK